MQVPQTQDGLSRVDGYACNVRKIVTQSTQKGTREVFRLDIPGRVVLDTYEKFREDHNLRSYKLNELGKHFLKQEKFDMPYDQIPIKYQSVEGRTEICLITACRIVIWCTSW